jgi:UDP-N-acetyl-D-glucosamine/UDP-N-acetyl-D-galactosamine dehydrogenase
MKHRIGILGLGYVGLPLAVEFAKKFEVVGFDINQKRISELRDGIDLTREVSKDELQNTPLIFSSDLADLAACNIYIVTVPTPIDEHKRPDLKPLISASNTVGQVLKKGDIVIYESTVYPGCTEEDCVPVLEKKSGLRFNTDFFCGYSPERMNPGDKARTVKSIVKVTSGSTPEAAKTVNELYGAIVEAGTYLASSIRVAEAAKVIENTQRDINIAFVNELAVIFNKMGLNTNEVLEAAGTKWNFLGFSPGLVGGHCIGVDPYYLTFKAEALGHHPQVILSGRRINDSMGEYVANQVIKLMIKKSHKVDGARVLLLGLSFKENCPDIRNTKVVDIHRELKEFGCNVDIYDPWALKDEAKHEYGIDLVDHPETKLDELISKYAAVVFCVAHKQFASINLDKITDSTKVIYDVKNICRHKRVDARL